MTRVITHHSSSQRTNVMHKQYTFKRTMTEMTMKLTFEHERQQNKFDGSLHIQRRRAQLIQKYESFFWTTAD